MNVDKIRNLTDVELTHQQRELSDQLFKMKFQLKMGQTESLKKIRELKKDIARVKTVMRQKQLAGGNGATAEQAKVAAAPAAAEKPAKRGLLRRKSK
jgi:large subunit ribosomal protein L29